MADKITVKFYGLLRRRIGAAAVEVAGDGLSVLELLRLAEDGTGRKFTDELLDGRDALLAGTIILVDGVNIRSRQDLRTPVPAGSRVDLFSPAVGG